MYTVSIFTEGGGSKGLGHVMRCIGLYDAFEQSNFEPLLILFGDSSCEKHLQSRKFRSVDWLEKYSDEAKDLEADVLIVDSYNATENFYAKCLASHGVTIILDDNIRMVYQGGTVLNGAMNAETMSYPKNDKVKYLLGVQFTPLRKEFWNHAKRETRAEMRDLLIIMGGSDVRSLSCELAKQIKSKFPEIVVTIVGSIVDNERHDEINYISGASAAELRDIMARTDLAISAAGQTIYELARMGVPTVAIEVVANQKDNVKGWLEAGFIEYAGKWDDPELHSNLVKRVKLLSSSGERKKRSVRGQEFIDGQGALRLVDYCKSVLD